MTFYLLGLGSNIQPAQHLSAAIDQLTELGEVMMVSEAVETAPVGDDFDRPFVNQLLLLRSSLVAPQLKFRLQQLEINLGREPKTPARKFKDRTIDIDILHKAGDANSCLQATLEDSYNRSIQQRWLRQLAQPHG